MSTTAISVIIPTKDRPHAVAHTVSSIVCGAHRNFELMVIDQSESETTRSALDPLLRSDSRLSYLTNRLPGFGAASSRNLGLVRARHELIAVTDDDVEAPVDWLERIVDAFDNDPELEFLIGSLESPEGLGPDEHAPFFIADPTMKRRRIPLNASGASFSFRRRLIDRAGGYDEFCGPGSRLRASDDTDFSFRLIRADARYRLDPNVRVIHRHGVRGKTDSEALMLRYAYGNGGNFGRFTRRGDLPAGAWFMAREAKQIVRVIRAPSAYRRTQAQLVRQQISGFIAGFKLPPTQGFVGPDELARRRAELVAGKASYESMKSAAEQAGKLDICLVGFLLGHGGDAIQMFILARELTSRGHSVEIIVPDRPESKSLQHRCNEAGITCIRTSSLAADLSDSRQPAWKLISLFRSLRGRTVHVHTGNSVLPRMAWIAIALARLDHVIVTIHSAYETIPADSRTGQMWGRFSTRFLDTVVSPSLHGTNFQLRCGVPASTAITINNGIDVRSVSTVATASIRSLLGLDETARIVLFCSRIDNQKRPVDAVEIFARASTGRNDARLVFVGEGTLETEVRVTAERLGVTDRIHLVGYQLDVEQWLQEATVWLLPTERENLSLAVLEALAAGCAIVSTNCPGNDEVLIDETNALTFAVGDVEEGAIALGRLLDDADLRSSLSAGARRTSESYTTAVMVDQYERLLNAPSRRTKH